MIIRILRIGLIAALILFFGCGTASDTGYSRKRVPAKRFFQNGYLFSNSYPDVRIKMKEGAFFGGLDYVRDSSINSENFIFADTSDGSAKSLLIITFENYLPGGGMFRFYPFNPVKIGRFDFTFNIWFLNLEYPNEAENKGLIARARTFLNNKNIRINKDIVAIRFFKVFQPDSTHSFAISYAEPLSNYGCTPADLSPGGKARGKMTDIQVKIAENALKKFSFE